MTLLWFAFNDLKLDLIIIIVKFNVRISSTSFQEKFLVHGMKQILFVYWLDELGKDSLKGMHSNNSITSNLFYKFFFKQRSNQEEQQQQQKLKLYVFLWDLNFTFWYRNIFITSVVNCIHSLLKTSLIPY